MAELYLILGSIVEHQFSIWCTRRTASAKNTTVSTRYNSVKGIQGEISVSVSPPDRVYVNVPIVCWLSSTYCVSSAVAAGLVQIMAPSTQSRAICGVVDCTLLI